MLPTWDQTRLLNILHSGSENLNVHENVTLFKSNHLDILETDIYIKSSKRLVNNRPVKMYPNCLYNNNVCIFIALYFIFHSCNALCVMYICIYVTLSAHNVTRYGYANQTTGPLWVW